MTIAFTNAYNWALEDVLSTCNYIENSKEITSKFIWLTTEQALRDWDAFVGPRHNDYKPEQYELTDSEWYDCQDAVIETVKTRLNIDSHN